MKIFLAYRFTDEDINELEKILSKIKSILESKGGDVFCSLFLEDRFQNKACPTKNLWLLLEKIKEHEIILFFIKSKGKSKGMGTGYGLFLTKLSLESFGGFIAVHSNVGEGSTFEFSMPLYGKLIALNRPRMNKFLHVAISGFMGSGKRTVSHLLAGYYGLRYLNSGFLVRAIIFTFFERKRWFKDWCRR